MNKIILILIFIVINSAFANLEHIENYSKKLELTQKEKLFLENNPIIKVGVETNWPPFDFVENNTYQGVAKDYLDLIEKKSGIKFKYLKSSSWDKLLTYVKDKEVDLLPILSKSKKREEFLNFTNTNYLNIRSYIFSKSDVTYKSFDDLKGKTLALPKGYIQAEFFKKTYPSIKIHYVKDILGAIDAVLTNKADFFTSNIALVQYLKKKNNITGIKANFYTSENSKLYMATRKDFPLLKSILDKTFRIITLEEKNRIFSKWFINEKEEFKGLTKEEQKYIKNNPDVYIANELNWMPIDFNENGKAKGYAVEYMKLLLSKVDLNPVFISNNWNNLYKKFKDKQIDILPVIAYDIKRENLLNYLAKPIYKQKFVIVTNDLDKAYFGIDDLSYMKVGMLKNWNLTKYVKNKYKNIDIIEYENITKLFKDIQNKKIDATIQSYFVSKYFINRYFPFGLKINHIIDSNSFNNHLYVGVQKDNSKLTSILEKAQNKVTDSEITDLENRWLSSSKEINFTEEELKFIKEKVVNVAYTDNWEPMSFEQNGQPYGLGFDFWNYVEKKTGLKSNFVFKSNFSKALDDIRNKRDDIIITTSKTADRKKYAIFSNTYFEAPIGIATLQDKNYIAGATELFDKRVGVGENYTAHKLLKEKYPQMKFVTVKNVQEGLKLLSNNEIYAFVDSMPILVHNIQKHSYNNIKIAGDTKVNFNLQMMIRDDYEVLRSIINKVLAKMGPETKKRIYNKWSKIEYTQKFDYSVLWKYFLPLFIIIIVILYKNRQLISYQKNLKKTQFDLQNSVNSFKTLINLTIEGIVIIKDKKILFYNDEFLKMFHLNIKNIYSINISSLIDSSSNHTLGEILKRSKLETYEAMGVKQSNKRFPIMIKSKSIMYDSKECDIITIIDMSDIKNKENLLIQQSKMASLGEMIGNIAHQWRQPLSFISTAASGMKLQKQFDQLDDKSFNNTIDDITKTTRFLSQTIDDFQNYLKTDKEKKEFYVEKSIDKVLNIVKSSFANNSIQILKSINNISIKSYENELNQVLLNILNNSKDALKEQEVKNKYIQINTYVTNNSLYIQIVDNGGGIKPKVLERVFDPYFTTKHQSQGTGLGLYMTHKIINESLNGQIEISNITYEFENKKYDKCTEVKIKIPLS